MIPGEPEVGYPAPHRKIKVQRHASGPWVSGPVQEFLETRFPPPFCSSLAPECRLTE